MKDEYAIKIWELTYTANVTASNINCSFTDRLYCTKFLFKLNKEILALNYEGNKFEIYYTVYFIVALIKIKHGTEMAYKNLIAFYPELDQPWMQEAIDSELFDLTIQGNLL